MNKNFSSFLRMGETWVVLRLFGKTPCFTARLSKKIFDWIDMVFSTKFHNSRRNIVKTWAFIRFWSLYPLFFIKFLFFTKWWSFKNYEKCFLFHLKSSFRSRNIQIFVHPSSPLFFPFSHCFRGWFKKYWSLWRHQLSKWELNTLCLIFWERNKVWHWNFIHW